MNKTLTIALAGFSIIIEEEAYHQLAHYLQALRNSLDADEADEIMHDIEMRIVEILKEKLATDKREVAYPSDIQKIIELIGTPAQINNQSEDENTQNFHLKSKTPKILFRNPDDKVFAGVASGLATYLGIKTIWIRILFILLSFTLITIVAYISLWILMPVANTASDKLKMKGQPLNFENIKEQSIEFARKADQHLGNTLDGLTPIMQNAGNKITQLVIGILKIIRYIFGAIFLLHAIVMVGGVVLGLSVAVTKDFSLFQNLRFYVDNNFLIFTGFLAATLWCTLLTALFIILAVKCLYPKKRIPYAGKLLGGLALLAFIGTMICVSYPIKISAQQDAPWLSNQQSFGINTTKDTLYIQQRDTVLSADFKNYWDGISSDGKTIFKKSNTYIEVIQSEDANAKLEIVTSYRNNRKNIVNINYPIKISNNTIILPNQYSFDISQKLTPPVLDIKLIVPNNKTVKLESGLYTNDQTMNKIDSAYHQTHKAYIESK